MTNKAIAIAAPLVRKSEGLRLRAYVCPAGKLTIGYGHTGPDVTPNMLITVEQAEKLLADDLGEAATAVADHVLVTLTAHQEAALIDFVFNLGEGNLYSSTLLRKLNERLYDQVPDQLRRWVYGKVRGKSVKLPGLVTRREAACVLWSTDA